ncbi:hypothetical protein JFU37_29905 [Pseudomonas sp. TH41]|nr:hypothetical protein [Pseudomonas sp. TH41]MBK5356666.1 hypothetical protein [Pseudomonas sp. TH41]
MNPARSFPLNTLSTHSWAAEECVMSTMLVGMILIWFNVPTPEYLRATVG